MQITNIMEPRTTGAINPGPHNTHRGHKFLNLTTSEVIIRRKRAELPLPSEVALCLEEISNDRNDGINLIMDEEVDDIMTEDQELQQNVDLNEGLHAFTVCDRRE
jgi:hypothetical protein